MQSWLETTPNNPLMVLCPFVEEDGRSDFSFSICEMGYHSGMKYMENNLDKKRDMTKNFPDAKSIISLGMNYYPNGDFTKRAFGQYRWSG